MVLLGIIQRRSIYTADRPFHEVLLCITELIIRKLKISNYFENVFITGAKKQLSIRPSQIRSTFHATSKQWKDGLRCVECNDQPILNGMRRLLKHLQDHHSFNNQFLFEFPYCCQFCKSLFQIKSKAKDHVKVCGDSNFFLF